MDINLLHQKVQRDLRLIPGVIGVGYGYKETGGKLTYQVGFRVYVREKKNKNVLPPDEIIPETIEGVPTDVLVLETGKSYADCSDTKKYDPIVGGIAIQPNYQKWLQTIASLLSTGALTPDGITDYLNQIGGTLGFFGTLNGDSSRDNIVLLTNSHVVAPRDMNISFGDPVNNPNVTNDMDENKKKKNLNAVATFLDKEKSNYLYSYPGELIPTSGKTPYFIDCAIAKVLTSYSSCCHTNCGVDFEPKVNKLETVNSTHNNLIRGVARLAPADLKPNSDYKVYKVGKKTGATVGKVKAVMEPANILFKGDAAPTVCNNIMTIVATANNCEGVMNFSDHGDSGSVIVNDKDQIIGLLFGGGLQDGVDVTYACHIHPILERLKISLICTPDPNIKNKVSGLEAKVATKETSSRKNRLALLESQLLCHPEGEILYELLQENVPEMVKLVNNSKYVTVIWQRNQGPLFLSHFIKYLDFPEHQIPPIINHISFPDLISNMKDALYRYGTRELKAFIEKYAAVTMCSASESERPELFFSTISNYLFK